MNGGSLLLAHGLSLRKACQKQGLYPATLHSIHCL
ncbi:Uncharacterised protein [Vibrio cholerae]|nr:Uncharacterised protein [Vibrio cholerae]